MIDNNLSFSTLSALQQKTQSVLPTQSEHSLWGSDGFTFGDIVDMVNPLQHIPVVGTLYREITGDEIAPISKIAGGGIFGGAIGAGTAALDTVVDAQTGKDIGEHALSLIGIQEEASQIAANDVTPPEELLPQQLTPEKVTSVQQAVVNDNEAVTEQFIQAKINEGLRAYKNLLDVRR